MHHAAAVNELTRQQEMLAERKGELVRLESAQREADAELQRAAENVCAIAGRLSTVSQMP
jgi:hypothetical protein